MVRVKDSANALTSLFTTVVFVFELATSVPFTRAHKSNILFATPAVTCAETSTKYVPASFTVNLEVDVLTIFDAMTCVSNVTSCGVPAAPMVCVVVSKRQR